MQMMPLLKDLRFYSVLVGVGGALVLYWLHFYLGFSSQRYMDFWLKFGYPVFLLCSFFFCIARPRTPWLFPVWMMLSFYVGTLFLLPGAGELFPLEVLLIALFTIPGIAVAYLGAYLSTRSDKDESKGPPISRP